MTDDEIRKKVASAIARACIDGCGMEYNDDTVHHYTQSFKRDADAALAACGYWEIRRALQWALPFAESASLDQSAIEDARAALSQAGET